MVDTAQFSAEKVMAMKFKSFKFLYYVLAVLGFAANAVILSPLTEDDRPVWMVITGVILWLVYSLVWILLSAVAMTLLSNWRYKKKITNRLFEECDPPKLIEIMEKKFGIKKGKPLRTDVLLELSTAYLNSEHKEVAKQLLDGVRYFPDNKVGAGRRVVYYNNLFLYFLDVRDLASAENVLNNMRASLDNPKLEKTVRNAYFTTYTEKLFLLNMAKGDYGGAEQIFAIQYYRADTMYAKVKAVFTLGRIYLHEGRMKDAESAFQYVIEHGNKLSLVQEAKQCLNEVGQK